MSSKSGIETTRDAVDAFKSLVQGQARAVCLKISDEKIRIDFVTEASTTFEDAWSVLNKQLPSDEPRYVFISKSHGFVVFVSYVPDEAAVRDKMLYASSKTSMLRQLGNSDLIKKQMFANDLDEISVQGWHDFEKADKVAAPLSASELALKQIDESEAQAISKIPVQTRSALVRMDHSSNMQKLKVDDRATSALQSLEKQDLVLLSIVSEQIVYWTTVHSVDETSVVGVLDDHAGIKYAFYRNSLGATVFIYSCPSGAKIKDRMIYAASKSGLLNHVRGQGLEVDNVVEVGDAEEIEISELKTGKAAGARKTFGSSGSSDADSDGEAGVDTSSLAPLVQSQLRRARPKPPRRA